MALSAFKPGPIRESAIICCALRFVEQRRFAKAELTRSIQVKNASLWRDWQRDVTSILYWA